jgi:hypothetical protein
LKANKEIRKEAAKELKLLNDPFARAVELSRLGLLPHSNETLWETWKTIGSGISDEEVKAWEEANNEHI